METAVAALIIITVILFGVLTLGHGYLSAQEGMMQSWRAMEAHSGQRARTAVHIQAAVVSAGGDTVQVSVRNDGSTKLADFPLWDVVLEYSSPSAPVARWYPYATAGAPGANQWAVQGIYQDAGHTLVEAYNPGILDPGEEMVISIRVSPPVAAGSALAAAVCTPNGVVSWRAETP